MLKVDDQLDQEWVDLILEALEMGISEEEIKTFLREHSKKIG
jgi:DNA-binding transcriptional MerR regulator